MHIHQSRGLVNDHSLVPSSFDIGRFPSEPVGTEPADISFSEISAMLWRRKFINLAIMIFFVGAAIGVSLIMHKKYQATSEMIVLQAASPQQSLAQANETTAAILSGVTTPLVETPDTQVAMISSDGMAQRTVDYLKNEALQQHKTRAELHADIDPDELLTKILAINPKGTNLLEVSVTSDTPESARILTDAVSQAFVQWKREVAQASVDQMTANLGSRAARAHQTMLAAEKRQMDFEKRFQVVDIPEQEKESLAQLFGREGDVAALQQEAAAHQVRLAEIAAQLSQANHAIGAGTGVRDDTLILSLQQQLNQAQMDLAAAQRKYTTAYPSVLSDLKAHVDDVKLRLDRAVSSAVRGDSSLQSQSALKDAYQQEQVALVYVQRKLSAATAQREKLSADTARWPALHGQYQRLANEADLDRTVFANLESEVSAANSGKDMTTGNVQITQVALLPDLPSSPKIPLNIALGAVLGIVVCLITTLKQQAKDKRIHTPEDALKLMTGPCVGTVPNLTALELRELRVDMEEGFGRDAFGLAAVNLMLLSQRDVEGKLAVGSNLPQVIVVTSALPGEGKSLVASELAKAIARSSRSVVLLDADLRRPTQHHLFGLNNNAGLVNVLTKGASVDDVIVDTETANLQIVTSGSLGGSHPQNPTGLLSQPMMLEVLSSLSSRHDVVIIDTPPSAVVPDALYLAPYADCVVQVIGVKYGDSDAVREATAAIYGAAPGAVAFLMNRAPRRKSGRYGDAYHYGKPVSKPRLAGTRFATAHAHAPSQATELVAVAEGEQEN